MALLSTLYNAVSSIISLAPGKSVQVDLQTAGDTSDDAELYHLPGLYSVPIDGVHGVCLDVADNNIIIATHDYRFNKTLDKGEAILYSMDANGVIKASCLVNKSGEFVINDGTDYGVKYSALETAFNQLKTDFNTLVGVVNGNVSVFNGHLHILNPPVAVTNASASPETVGAMSMADITPAKVLKVRI
jgi:phage gp45-like